MDYNGLQLNVARLHLNTLKKSDIDHTTYPIFGRVMNTIEWSDFTPRSNHSTEVNDKKSELHSLGATTQ